MPSIAHEAPLELLRADPQLAAVLMQALGLAIPPGAAARLVPAELTAPLPAEFRADAVVLLEGDDEKLAVITEVQLTWDDDKEFTWPTYLTQVRAAHRCAAVLLVICPDPAAAQRSRATISTGHPGFDLTPLVVDARTMPLPGGPGTAATGPELVVLAVLTGALDLEQDHARRLVLASLAKADESRRTAYTVFILNAASAAAHQALEDLMATTKFSDPFVDRFLAEGKAEGLAEGEAKGEARMILRVLAARGLDVPEEIRQRVLSCADTAQLETWGDRAATAASVEDVFGS
jgi:uncharacterized protein (DUF1778 family)